MNNLWGLLPAAAPGSASNSASVPSPTIYTKLSPEDLAKTWSTKRVLIVGGTNGIGRALAIALLKYNAKVTIVGKSGVSDPLLYDAKSIQKDCSSMRACTELAGLIDPKSLDIIVFTLGIMACPERKVTSDGIEEDLATSFLSRMAIANQIIKDGKFTSRKQVANTPYMRPRIFIMGFPGKEQKGDLEAWNSAKSYEPITAHGNTILGNETLIDYLAAKEIGINVYGLNPGYVQGTNIRKNLVGDKASYLGWAVESGISVFAQTATQYAENTLLHLLASPSLEDKGKSIFEWNGTLLKPNPFLTPRNRQKIISLSEDLISSSLKNTSTMGKLFNKVNKFSEKLENEVKEATTAGAAAIPNPQDIAFRAVMGGGFSK